MLLRIADEFLCYPCISLQRRIAFCLGMNAWHSAKDDSAEWWIGKGSTRIGLYLVAQFLQALEEDRLDMGRLSENLIREANN